MDVSERLTNEDLERGDYLAASHLHRYEVAAALCAGLRVLDLACGIGYGTEMLAARAASAHGVDIDEGSIEEARRERGADGVTFQAGDAVAFLRGTAASDYDAIVMYEGIEHVPDPEAVLAELERLAAAGTRVIVSVPNSRAFREQNEFHVTDFGYAEARRAFSRFDEVTMLYQVLAEGSLILSGEVENGAIRAHVAALDTAEPEYANDFIGVIGFEQDAVHEITARLNLVATPGHNRYMIDLERSNSEYFRTNRQLARGIYGKRDAAAATFVARLEAERRRADELEAQIKEVQRELWLERAWRDAPRYHMVDQLVAAIRKVPGLAQVAALTWRVVGRRFSRRPDAA